MGGSDGLHELYELGPLLLPRLHALPDGLELSEAGEGVLYIFGVLLAHDHEDGIIELVYAIFIDHPRGVRQVLQPLTRQHYLNFLVIPVFVVEGHHHLS